ncbi:GNAT family N-acetyltransferase [Gramella lutea]|uniref:GNAT family N-acetyltransferase n=1 Tax=Christiangramia lutea TaxID=1607951 RepID=A0A9X1V7B9_9FLAO|nr:GNAT family N-acetyltransferase [Christiangramia lutea]MCH4824384.1 GNAT family N-acetyltransferase [Christiangramia lutea]
MKIRKAQPNEFEPIGKLLVEVYSSLEGFPNQNEQPDYYEMLLNIGEITNKPNTQLLVALSDKEEVMGAVVYFSDMSSYGSGGTATTMKKASGFRLLAVDPEFRGRGVGKGLSIACIKQARKDGNNEIIIHSTEFMKLAWSMYEKLGFKRSQDLDFIQKELPVYGFRLKL